MILEVVEFNKKRNKLELDFNLELDMLHEEIKEFWDAETTAERLDALVDLEYVWIGTKVKCSYNATSYSDLEKSIQGSLEIMAEYMDEELGEYYYDCLCNARKIVCNANTIKGSKLDENGKVFKDDAYKERVDATKQIALMIEDVTKPKGY